MKKLYFYVRLFMLIVKGSILMGYVEGAEEQNRMPATDVPGYKRAKGKVEEYEKKYLEICDRIEEL